MKIKTRFSACLAAGAFLALTPAAFAQFSIAGLVEGANSVEVAPASVGSTVDGRPMIGVMLTTEGGAPAIQSVIKKSPAEKAGLEAGDVIRSVGDKKVKSLDDLQGLLGGLSVGDEVQIGVDRDGNRKTLTLTLADSEDLDIPVGEMIEIGDAPKAKSLKEVKRKEKSEKKTNKTNKAN
ncbi:MAG: S1-C subfamily serine protease, partial [Candidatus Paceibacteria bacterium]